MTVNFTTQASSLLLLLLLFVVVARTSLCMSACSLVVSDVLCAVVGTNVHADGYLPFGQHEQHRAGPADEAENYIEASPAASVISR